MFKKLTFEYNVFMNPLQNQPVEITSDNWILSVNGEKLSPEKSRETRDRIEELGLETWQDNYWPEGFYVMDGYSWSVILERSKPKEIIEKQGDNAYPWCFYQPIRIVIDVAPETKKELNRFAKEVKCFC